MTKRLFSYAGALFTSTLVVLGTPDLADVHTPPTLTKLDHNSNPLLFNFAYSGQDLTAPYADRLVFHGLAVPAEREEIDKLLLAGLLDKSEVPDLLDGGLTFELSCGLTSASPQEEKAHNNPYAQDPLFARMVIRDANGASVYETGPSGESISYHLEVGQSKANVYVVIDSLHFTAASATLTKTFASSKENDLDWGDFTPMIPRPDAGDFVGTLSGAHDAKGMCNNLMSGANVKLTYPHAAMAKEGINQQLERLKKQKWLLHNVYGAGGIIQP